MAKAGQYRDIISLGRGDVDLDTPPNIIEAAHRAILAGENRQSPVEGLYELREAIARRVKRVNNIDANPETNICVTNGGQEALLMICLTLLKPGDEIIVPVPTYNTYADAINVAGGIQVDVLTSIKDNFALHPDLIVKAITDKTRCILLISPNNPSANVIEPDVVREIVAIAERHSLNILSDEIYDEFLYDGAIHLSPASLPNGKNRTVTLNALSKTYAMTGWRIGWAVGPEDLIRVIKQKKAGISGPTSVISQLAGVEALNGPQHFVQEAWEIYKERRQVVMESLDEMGLPYGKPMGGQFIYVDISSTGNDAITLADRLIEHQHVLIYPGVAFGKDWEDFVRITFLAPKDELKAGMDRLRAEVEAIRRGE